MIKCQRCDSKRILQASAKCSDCFGAILNGVDHDGYVPDDLGIGGGDYMEVNVCLDCGQLQGKFPKPPTQMEKDISDFEVLKFFENSFEEGEKICDIATVRCSRSIKYAEAISDKLRKFVYNVIDYNHDVYNQAKMPSAKKFLEMYRTNNWEIE